MSVNKAAESDASGFARIGPRPRVSVTCDVLPPFARTSKS